MVELFNSISKTLIKSELIIFISILSRIMIMPFELNYDIYIYIYKPISALSGTTSKKIGFRNLL